MLTNIITNIILTVLVIVCLASLYKNWKQYQAGKEHEKQFHDTTLELLRWGIEESVNYYSMINGLLRPHTYITQNRTESEQIICIRYEDSNKPLALISLNLSLKNKEVLLHYDRSTSKHFALDGARKPRYLISHLRFRPDPTQDPH